MRARTGLALRAIVSIAIVSIAIVSIAKVSIAIVSIARLELLLVASVLADLDLRVDVQNNADRAATYSYIRLHKGAGELVVRCAVAVTYSPQACDAPAVARHHQCLVERAALRAAHIERASSNPDPGASVRVGWVAELWRCREEATFQHAAATCGIACMNSEKLPPTASSNSSMSSYHMFAIMWPICSMGSHSVGCEL